MQQIFIRESHTMNATEIILDGNQNLYNTHLVKTIATASFKTLSPNTNAYKLTST